MSPFYPAHEWAPRKNPAMMSVMRTLRYTLCVLLLAQPAFGGGAPEGKPKPKKTVSFSLSRLQSTYKKSPSLEAEITQVVYQASLARTKTSRGSLKLAKPNLMRWEIYEPEASVTVSNGRKVFYFTPDARGKGKGQVIERNAKALEEQPLFRILTGASSLEKEFRIKKKEKDGDLTVLLLEPKKEMGDLAELTLKANPKYLIEELILTTQSGNKTTFSLQNQTLGAKLPAQIFDFKAPPGTEIVQN